MSAACNLNLCSFDGRTSPIAIQERQVSFSQETAAKAHEVVCDFFSVTDGWDKNLFKSILSEDVKTYDLFYLDRQDRPEISYKIEVVGKKELLVNYLKRYEPFPIEDRGLFIFTKRYQQNGADIINKGRYVLEEIISAENSIVALFNSSFTSLSEHGKKFSRRIEKYDIKPNPKSKL
jgi:hypothetical protein